MRKPLLVSLLLSMSGLVCLQASSQGPQGRYVIGVDIFGSSEAGCPVFIGRVSENSPAERAGIHVGDQLQPVDGSPVAKLQNAALRLRSSTPGPVAVTLLRGEAPYTVTVERKEYGALLGEEGLKRMPDGNLIDRRASDGEMKQQAETLKALEREESRTTIFPGHYPANQELYYPGFEIFVWDQEKRVTVGGIENGPAKHSGVRWGDPILAVNGIDPRGKTVAELETLFSSVKPASMELVIDRAGVRKKFSFDLAAAATVLLENHWRMADGKMVPLWLPDKYLYCEQ